MANRSKLLIIFASVFSELIVQPVALKQKASASQTNISLASLKNLPFNSNKPGKKSLVGQINAAKGKLDKSIEFVNTTIFSSVPTCFNINCGIMEYPFIYNPWPSKNTALAADLDDSLDSIDWEKDGVIWVMLGFDVNLKLMLDLTPSRPKDFYLFLYNGHSNTLLGYFQITSQIQLGNMSSEDGYVQGEESDVNLLGNRFKFSYTCEKPSDITVSTLTKTLASPGSSSVTQNYPAALILKTIQDS